MKFIRRTLGRRDHLRRPTEMNVVNVLNANELVRRRVTARERNTNKTKRLRRVVIFCAPGDSGRVGAASIGPRL